MVERRGRQGHEGAGAGDGDEGCDGEGVGERRGGEVVGGVGGGESGGSEGSNDGGVHRLGGGDKRTTVVGTAVARVDGGDWCGE